MSEKILIIDDDAAFLELTSRFLSKNGMETKTFESWSEARKHLRLNPSDLILVDLHFPGISGIQIIQEIRQFDSGTPILMITAHSSIQTAIEAVKAGALDYIQKPCDNSEILFKIHKALDSVRKDREIEKLRSVIDGQYSFHSLVTKDEDMKKVFHLAEIAAGLDVIVMISGETGTGKEVLAKTIHMAGPKSSSPFRVFNCAAVNENLVESELFGHKKGAFTSAHADKQGLCETVEDGTLFIDEIGELSLGIQKKLLRLLQEREFESVGSTRTEKFRGRLITATHRNLRQMVQDGAFREDLFYRINVFPIHIKALRDRMADFIDISNSILNKYTLKYGKTITGFSEATSELMMKYSWPGNIRELDHFIERQVLISRGSLIDVTMTGGFAGFELGSGAADGQDGAKKSLPADSVKNYNDFMKNMEQEYLVNLMQESRGSIEKASAIAGIHRKTLYMKLKDHNLDKKIFK